MYLVSGSSLFYGWFKKNMDSIKGTVEIYDLDEYNYPKFRGQLIGLYLHAFTTGDYSQHICKTDPVVWHSSVIGLWDCLPLSL